MGTVVRHGGGTTQRRGLIETAKHGDKSTGDGQGNYDPAKSKDAGGGRHSSQDKGDRDDQGDDKGKK